MNTPDFSSKASIGLTHRIPGGYFLVGSRFHQRESPVRQVFLHEFDITNIPVTVSQYSTFLESGGYQQDSWWSPAGCLWLKKKADGWGRDNRLFPDGWILQKRRESHPVVGITWFEAEAYCHWLTFYKKKVIRLPNEIEWEYASRGEDGRPFPWGEEFDSTLTNTFESGRFDTIEAASIESDCSPFGVHDMAGNVQEWTSTIYTQLPAEEYPAGPLFIARGGSFNDTAYGSRTSYRRAYPPGYFFPFLGFRIVIEDR